MSILRVVKILLLVMASVLAGCEDGMVPETLRAPALPSVSAVAEGSSVVLTGEFESEEDLLAAKEFGFYFGQTEDSMERLTVTNTDGLKYSLIKESLEYSTTYCYKAWVGNGRDEKSSDLKEIMTEEEPVGPDPPSPVERNIEFKDPVVKAICVRNWDLDGDGELSKAEAAKVTNLRQVFKRNEEITSFEELEYFTGLRSVADSAFKCCINLRSVKLSESVIVIGDHAFEECGEVVLPKLPDNLTSLGESAFCFCAKLSLTSLPETLTSIGNWAFSCCTNLALTTLPSGLTSIGDGTFNRCFNIVPEELPSGLTKVGSWAFSECSSLNPKSLPEGVKTLGQNAFGGCASLTWTQLPSSLHEMGNWAFAQCWKVGFSSIPEGVVKICKAAFEGCFLMKSITLPESLQVIDSLAFNGLPLKEVTIPENVTFIGGDAFKGSDRMMAVKLLPKTPPVMEDTYLGDNADVIYVHAESLKKYKTSKNWNKWKDKYEVLPGEEIPPEAIDIDFKDPAVKAICVENWDLDGDGELSKAEAAKVTNLRQVFKRNEEITSFEELEYFTGLKSVADSAFKCCPNLTELKLPEGLRTVGDNCFSYCTKLRIKTLPESLTSVEGGAFTYCTSLALTELPESLTNIAWFAFDHCTSLALTKLPSGMTRIEGGAFANCPNVAPEKLPSGLTYVGPWAFFECTSFNPEALPESVTEIDHNAFSLCTSLAWTRLPDNVVEIGEAAFTYCWKLRLTSLPPKLTRIENETFNETRVAPAELPKGLKYVGERAFMNCSEFNPANLPSGVIEVGARAFFGCSSLSWKELPENLIEIGEYAFYLCPKVKFTSLPENITKIHKAVFENCTGIEEIKLPDHLNSIEANAFKNCKFLEITIPKEVEFIGPEAFNGCNLLRKVTILTETPPDMEDTFLGDNANVIFVPSASIEKYRTATNWSEWKTKYKALTDSDSGKDPGTGSGDDPGNDQVPYMDGGVDYGDGIVIDGTVWAPVNCGYHPDDYPFGKVYQWGRKFGFGYSDSNYKDASSPVLREGPVKVSVGLSEINSNVFFTTTYGSWVLSQDATLWNKGTESDPVKTENDPCPAGWRVPTFREITALKAHYSSIVTYEERKGRWFSGSKTYGSGVPAIFLPLAGYIDNSGKAKHRQVGDSDGNPEGLYWASKAYDSVYCYYIAEGLRLTPTYVDIVCGQADAYTIRCVAE